VLRLRALNSGSSEFANPQAPPLHQVNLTYSEPLLRAAVTAFWFRSVGLGLLIAIAVGSVGLAWLIGAGWSSWEVWALATVLLLCLLMVIAVFVVHYRNAIHKFRQMGDSDVTFRADEMSFTMSSSIGTTTLQWTVVQELWQFRSVWLMLYSKAQFTTLPLDCLSADMQAYVVNRIQSAGGKVVV
jgi:hypothetical protein